MAAEDEDDGPVWVGWAVAVMILPATYTVSLGLGWLLDRILRLIWPDA